MPIQTLARLNFSYQTFHEVETTVFVDKTPAASVTLQIFWIATDRFPGKSRRGTASKENMVYDSDQR